MPSPPKDDEAFLARWSRRKREGDEAEPVPAETAPSGASAPNEEEALSDEEILEKLGLPDPQILAQGDDVSGFMAPQVPEHLRRVALRFLWRSNPVLANVDGLVDYGEDFTDAATVIENLQTVYEVGKGAAGRVRAELDALAEERRREAESSAAEERATDTDEAADGGERAEPNPASAIEDADIRQDPLDIDSIRQEQSRIELPESAESGRPQNVSEAPRPKPARFRFE